MSRIEVRFSGSAGQGIVTAAKLLGSAAVLDGFEVAQVAEYGAAVRVGVSKADVILSRKEIDYPRAEALDYLVILSQEACLDEGRVFKKKLYTEELREFLVLEENCPFLLKKGGLVIVDSILVNTKTIEGKCPIEAYPFLEELLAKGVTRQSLNVAALSALVARTKVVSKDSLYKIVVESMPKRFRKSNEIAFEVGFNLIEKG